MSFLLDLLKTVLFGIVQGISELLPISSGAHIIILNALLNLKPVEFFHVFKSIIQIGSAIAMIWYYRNRINVFTRNINKEQRKNHLIMIGKILISCLPILLSGYFINNLIYNYLSEYFIVAISMISYSLIFIILKNTKHVERYNSIYELSLIDCLKLGAFGTLALIPGTSTLLAIYLGSYVVKCDKNTTIDFTFHFLIPVIILTALFDINAYRASYGWFHLDQFVCLILGIVVSFIVSFIFIKRCILYLKKHEFDIFYYYRIVLGIIILFFFYIL